MNEAIFNDLELLTVKDLVDRFKLSRSKVYDLAAKGKIPCIKLGGSTRFRPSTLMAWMQSQEKTNYGRAKS